MSGILSLTALSFFLSCRQYHVAHFSSLLGNHNCHHSTYDNVTLGKDVLFFHLGVFFLRAYFLTFQFLLQRKVTFHSQNSFHQLRDSWWYVITCLHLQNSWQRTNVQISLCVIAVYGLHDLMNNFFSTVKASVLVVSFLGDR